MAVAAAAGARRVWQVVLVAAVAATALALRFAAAPGADLDPATSELLGRAPRLDGFWYTRSAIDAARGAATVGVIDVFDRPLYTAWCRAIFAAIGTSAAAIPVPSIIAGALGVAVLVALGRLAGLGGAALLAGVFAATNWLSVLHDREPLVYSTVNLTFLLALLLWVRGLRSPVWFVPAWAGMAATAIWGKETVALALPSLLVAHVLHVDGARKRLRVVAVGGAVGIVAAAVVWLASPAAIASLGRKIAARAAFADVSFPGGWIVALGELPGTLPVIGRVPAIAALAAVGIAAVLLARRLAGEERETTLRQLLVLWLASGCLVTAGFSYRPTRYVLSLFPPAFLLAAHGLHVLWGRRETPVRGGRARTAAVLAVVWWIGVAALLSWLLEISPEAVRRGLPEPLLRPAMRLGLAAAIATGVALAQAARLAVRGAIAPSRRWTVALGVFVLVTDARGFAAHVRPVRYDDVAARRTFEAAVGPGALVAGYAAHYLALDPRYRVATDFRITSSAILGNTTGSTHLATLWVPELDYVERLLGEAGSPLHHVVDVVIERERYRVYRLPGAGMHGYEPTAFERAREREATGDTAAAAAAYRELVATEAGRDPGVLALAGAAIARVSPAEGLRLIERARVAAPRNGVIVLALADAAAALGHVEQAVLARGHAAALLPHELVLGFGQPAHRRPGRAQ